MLVCKIKNVADFESEKNYRTACDCFYYSEDTALALSQVEKILKLAPEHDRAWFLRGEIFLLENNIEEAIQSFEKFEEHVRKDGKKNTNRARNFANIAVCFEMLDDHQNALLYCDKALELISDEDWDFLPSLYRLQISALIKLKKYSKAKKALRELNSFLFSEDVHYLKTHLDNSIKLKPISQA
ncbi:hypothetical protein tpqmel_0436 [Candidatus Gastranaerophilus sp. (ex Termes propinquus)]|nr:hypothetical protein tpqmel_0436 [Candidatus Gastranaerophilus sp. (ex Termes propinquus)]